jgi:hypothetical protein
MTGTTRLGGGRITDQDVHGIQNAMAMPIYEERLLAIPHGNLE